MNTISYGNYHGRHKNHAFQPFLKSRFPIGKNVLASGIGSNASRVPNPRQI